MSRVSLRGALVLLLALVPCAGCAVIGAGIGSTIPKYEPSAREPVSEHASENSESQDQGVSMRTGTSSSSVGADGAGGGSDVAPTDNHWLEGFFIGLGVDVAVIAIVATNVRYLFPKTSSQFHAGADGVDVAGR